MRSLVSLDSLADKLGFPRNELANICLRFAGNPLLVRDGEIVCHGQQLIAFLDRNSIPIPNDPRVTAPASNMLGFSGTSRRRDADGDEDELADGDEDADVNAAKNPDGDRRPRRRR